ncbi:cytochrome c [Aestuariivirga sp.]|uniref:c-type cytochrome n=1 Tax=Aestuariivirga sp. TaxID=2650926 RepID=UPI003593026F
MPNLGRLARFGAFVSIAIASVFVAGAAIAEPDQGSIARGGKLYDKWYKVLKVDAPKESHKLYPASNKKYAEDAASNWRCKECHGWDGLGADGAYATGSHASGIKGINGMKGGDPAAVVALLKADAHGYGDKLAEQDLNDLANFVVYGRIDWSKYIADKKSTGDAEAGKQVFVTACIGCHGAEGKLPTGMPPLGSLTSNPWEVMHKILNGQPGEVMPALRAIDHQISANVLAYLGTLPAE